MTSTLLDAWRECLPEVKNGVTGVGVWAALNSVQPVLIEDDILVMGVPPKNSDLGGHLRMVATKTLIEKTMSQRMGRPLTVRIIDGVTEEDWATAKRRDAEAARLREIAIAKAQVENKARSSWDGVYEQLNRLYASIPNKSLPQNRARFYLDAIETMVEALLSNPIADDLAERNYARCIERISQYSEVPSVIIAIDVMKRSSG
jgi:hypothetical protein